ncbi:Helicase protein with RING/U-box domain [Dorcoceras hygrometricum]|uniref:Helicase protein with RING/U-box domain n=1 Tax=Dorcoceras hygrometricum TaxID=472368 RepID=A0A2Z7D0R5_9LAMI|nr:Helicase protein with RING/U-box domain [Dorcoceras hygrometricum]
MSTALVRADFLMPKAKTFPPLKIISAKTVNTYIATNKAIDARGESDEPEVAKVAIVKKKSMSKNKSASIPDKDADDIHVEVVAEKDVSKKRPAAVSEATVVKKNDNIWESRLQRKGFGSSERPHAQKRKAPKRKLRMTAGSDDEIVEKEPTVENVVVKQKERTSVVMSIILFEQVIAEIAQVETDVVEPDVAEGMAMETVVAELVVTRSDDITVEISERSIVVTDEESMSIEDLLQQIPGDAMFPSVFSAKPTKIKFELGIQIPGIHKVGKYKANLPKIAATDKGKEPLVVDTIQGHPAREIFSLICADIDFLIQLREQVIEAVATFFNSFSIRRLPALGSLEAIAAKEEKVLTWGETDSVQIALQRRVYIVAKYRELLLQKFLEARRHNFVSSTPTTAIDLKVLELLTTAHHFALKDLLRQILLSTTAAPATDINKQFAKLRASISQLSIKQMKAQSSIGNLQNHLLSRINDLEKASANARTQHDQDLRGLFKSVRQEVQIRKLPYPLKYMILSKAFELKVASYRWTWLIFVRKSEIYLRNSMINRAAIRNDLLEFHVETQEQYATLSANISELMAFATRGRDDKKGEVGSSHGRGQPPPEDRSKPGSGDGGSSGSRSEASRKRGSSGSRQRDWRYWISGSG